MRRHAKVPSGSSTSGLRSGRGLVGRAIRVALLCALGAALSTATAFAHSLDPTYDSSFDGSDIAPPPANPFVPDRLAADHASGDVYVLDVGNDVVRRFDADGNFLSTLDGANTTTGSFVFTPGWDPDVAVDNSGGPNQGNLYVVSENQDTLFAFDADGDFLWQAGSEAGNLCGVAVDSAGEVYVSDFGAATVLNYDPDGTRDASDDIELSSAPNPHPCHIAFDGSDNLFVNEWGAGVDRFLASTGYLWDGTVHANASYDVATDLELNEVFAVEDPLNVPEQGFGTQVATFFSTGSPGAGTPFGSDEIGASTGVAINAAPAFRNAYVSDQGNGLVHVYDLIHIDPLFTVDKPGTGGGTVTSDPPGISCGAICTHMFGIGTEVTLTATPNSISTFEGWTGCDSNPTTNTCQVTVDGVEYVTATFEQYVDPLLTVSKSGTGAGTVTSSPPGIACGADCTQLYTAGTVVTLTATPAVGSTFEGWSGACSNATGSCVVTMDDVKSATAMFEPLPAHTLTVGKAGAGAGAVTSSPAGIACGGDCSQAYGAGTVVTLTATPAAGSAFAGWSGGGCAGVGTCTVTMSASRSVTATFFAVHVDPPCAFDPAACTLHVEKTAKVVRGRALLKASCTASPPVGGPCRGELKLLAKVKVGKQKKTRTIGTAAYDPIAIGDSDTIRVALSKRAKRTLARAGRLKATLVAVSGSGLPDDGRTVVLKGRKKKR